MPRPDLLLHIQHLLLELLRQPIDLFISHAHNLPQQRLHLRGVLASKEPPSSTHTTPCLLLRLLLRHLLLHLLWRLLLDWLLLHWRRCCCYGDWLLLQDDTLGLTWYGDCTARGYDCRLSWPCLHSAQCAQLVGRHHDGLRLACHWVHNHHLQDTAGRQAYRKRYGC